jgi:hypothetical protein
MATNEVCISEFSDMVSTVRGAAQIPSTKPIAVQILALGASSVPSAAFNAATKYIRIAVSGVDARIEYDQASPTADAAASERFMAGDVEFRGVTAGNKAAVITAT